MTALAGGRLLAHRYGVEPANVVAMHGWSRSGRDFDAVLDGLDALSLDLPGFGESPAPDTVWGTEDYARLVVDTFRDRGPLVFVGHSFGGRIAVRIASQAPELLAGILLTGAPLIRVGTPPPPPLPFRIGRALNRRGLLSDKRMDSLRDRYGSHDYRVAHGVMRGVLVRALGEHYEDDLANVHVPVRMVWGSGDLAAPVAGAEAAAALMPTATLRVVEGAGHLMQDGLESAIREELDALLVEVGRRTA